MRFARAKSRFYAEKYRGLPDAIADVRILPPVTKVELMEHLDDVVTDPLVRKEDVYRHISDLGNIGKPFLGKFMDPDIFRLEGRSRIVDSDGTAVGELGSEEGILMADVTLDPARKHFSSPKSFDGWFPLFDIVAYLAINECALAARQFQFTEPHR